MYTAFSLELMFLDSCTLCVCTPINISLTQSNSDILEANVMHNIKQAHAPVAMLQVKAHNDSLEWLFLTLCDNDSLEWLFLTLCDNDSLEWLFLTLCEEIHMYQLSLVICGS